LNINEKDKDRNYLLLQATYRNIIEIIKLLMVYANKNSIVLKINEKGYKYVNYPLLEATRKDNIEIVKLLMDYANKNNIVLKINEFGIYYPSDKRTKVNIKKKS